MRIYTLHQPKDPTTEVVPVKEGFSWPAFFVSPLWALWHRLWFWAVGFVAANIVLGWILTTAGGNEFVTSTASFALALIIGWTANDLRRRKLTKRGFEESAVLVANNKETAIARFLMAAPTASPTPTNRAGGPW
ncbi:MAG: DUF2628 domain-containing protein [Rhodospirillaceae bacterium]|jgi:hypothetical protein|nr:DUF2628 domain-containing protein [Rhodospirillaceae bacterium]MBT4937619.1 DUF2628 domain-containing protein [Rhodospirillaceae bacterium]MBT7957190.1 DUF2628 domain-containing protein [Rhodospirillaceae bacterium]